MPLNAQRLREVLHYDPDTGVFTWLQHTWKKRIGTSAGGDDGQGYTQILVDGEKYRAHQLAVLYMTGEWPTHTVDHKRVGREHRSDNRWQNLRPATHGENMWNQSTRRDNTSGYRGVKKAGNRWEARFEKDKKVHRLGRFSTPEEANEAVAMARQMHYGEFAPGLEPSHAA